MDYLIFSATILGALFCTSWLERIEKPGTLTPLFFAFYAFLSICIFGTMSLLVQSDSYLSFSKLIDKHGFKLYLFNWLSILCFLLGASLKLPKNLIFFPDLTIDSKNLDIALALISVLTLPVVLLYIYRWQYVPLLEWLAEPGVSAGSHRSLGASLLPSSNWKFHIIFSHLLPLISWHFLNRWKVSFFCKFSFLCCFVLCTFMQSLSLQKAPITIYLFFTLTIVFLKIGAPIRRARRILILASFATAVFVTTPLAKELPIQPLITRTLLGQNVSAIFYLNHFPKNEEYTGIKSFPNYGILPFEPIPFSKNIWREYMSPDSSFSSGSSPAYFNVHLYMSFGFKAALLLCCIIGFIVRRLSLLTSSSQQKPLLVPLSTLFSMSLINLSLTSSTTAILNPSLYLAAGIYILLAVLSPLIKRTTIAKSENK